MGRAEKQVVSVQTQRVDRVLWLALLLGPVAMGINTIVGYTVAHWTCDTNRKIFSYSVSVFDITLTICAFSLAFRYFQRYKETRDETPENGRRNFMAMLGMLSSVFSLLLIIAGTLAVVILHPCD